MVLLFTYNYKKNTTADNYLFIDPDSPLPTSVNNYSAKLYSPNIQISDVLLSITNNYSETKSTDNIINRISQRLITARTTNNQTIGTIHFTFEYIQIIDPLLPKTVINSNTALTSNISSASGIFESLINKLIILNFDNTTFERTYTIIL